MKTGLQLYEANGRVSVLISIISISSLSSKGKNKIGTGQDFEFRLTLIDSMK
uniref:Uncharacterized protein n=1 Tax=Rhizophagus irregularis (strain DAOM 181602 / DAOM 197198 / MUCL 43194) TaxID=747089 RepID=U9TKS3_RHIID